MKDKSFTLIELLVVISIIGLLSSIVLVNLRGTREKARIAKVLEFSQSVYHALGADAVGIWRFDEGGTAITTYDSSGYGNNGSIIGGASFTPGIIGTALSFDGADDYVNCGSAPSITSPNVLTVEFWIKTALAGSGTVDLGGVVFGAPWTTDRIIIYGDVGRAQNYRYFAASVADNKWHHVVFILPGKDQTAINNSEAYVDGVSAPISSTAATASQYARIKCGIGGPGWYSHGLIDEVRIYDQALSVAEIQKHYTEGLAKHKNLVIR